MGNYIVWVNFWKTIHFDMKRVVGTTGHLECTKGTFPNTGRLTTLLCYQKTN